MSQNPAPTQAAEVSFVRSVLQAADYERAYELLLPEAEAGAAEAQYQIGLLPEEQWEASRNSIRGQADQQAFLDTWERERFQLRKSFADEVDEILKEEANR